MGKDQMSPNKPIKMPSAFLVREMGHFHAFGEVATFILTLKEPTRDCSTTEYQDGDGDQWHEREAVCGSSLSLLKLKKISKIRSTFWKIYMDWTQNTGEKPDDQLP